MAQHTLDSVHTRLNKESRVARSKARARVVDPNTMKLTKDSYPGYVKRALQEDVATPTEGVQVGEAKGNFIQKLARNIKNQITNKEVREQSRDAKSKYKAMMVLLPHVKSFITKNEISAKKLLEKINTALTDTNTSKEERDGFMHYYTRAQGLDSDQSDGHASGASQQWAAATVDAIYERFCRTVAFEVAKNLYRKKPKKKQ